MRSASSSSRGAPTVSDDLVFGLYQCKLLLLRPYLQGTTLPPARAARIRRMGDLSLFTVRPREAVWELSCTIIVVFFDKTPRYTPLDDPESAGVMPQAVRGRHGSCSCASQTSSGSSARTRSRPSVGGSSNSPCHTATSPPTTTGRPPVSTTTTCMPRVWPGAGTSRSPGSSSSSPSTGTYSTPGASTHSRRYSSSSLCASSSSRRWTEIGLPANRWLPPQ